MCTTETFGNNHNTHVDCSEILRLKIVAHLCKHPLVSSFEARALTFLEMSGQNYDCFCKYCCMMCADHFDLVMHKLQRHPFEYAEERRVNLQHRRESR